MFRMKKKQNPVLEKILAYFEQTDLACSTYKTVASELIRQSKDVDFAEEVEKVHVAEHAADELKRAVILELYKKALLPGSRGDILGLLETFDELPNSFQSVCNHIYFQKVVFPEQFRERIIDLIQINVDIYKMAKQAALCLFEETNITDKCTMICQKEAESDSREKSLIRDIFNAKIDLAEKMLLKSIIDVIGSTADLAEDVADRVERAIIKRRL